MTSEQRQPVEGYSGAKFLEDLERVWRGKLYIGIKSNYEDRLVNVSPHAYVAFRAVFDLDAGTKPGLPVPAITGDIAQDFQAHLVAAAPHSEEARDRVHLLADPFCRSLVLERVNNFFMVCANAQPDDINPVVDNLPFKHVGLIGSVLDTPLFLPNLDAYFDLAKLKAQALAQQLDLSEEEITRFTAQFQLAMDRYKYYTKLVEEERGADLHPIILPICHITLGDYYSRQ